jgi:hypothetical protein
VNGRTFPRRSSSRNSSAQDRRWRGRQMLAAALQAEVAASPAV